MQAAFACAGRLCGAFDTYPHRLRLDKAFVVEPVSECARRHHNRVGKLYPAQIHSEIDHCVSIVICSGACINATYMHLNYSSPQGTGFSSTCPNEKTGPSLQTLA